ERTREPLRVQARVVLLLAGAVFASSIFVSVPKASQASQQGLASGSSQRAGGQQALDAVREQQLLQQFCYGCHSERAKTAGLDSAKKLTLDTLDTTNVHRDAKTWELVARKLRAGMMPPAELRRPDPVTYQAMIDWLEGELDRDA